MKNSKIHMEFENTPMYNSAYIEGIGNLYVINASFIIKGSHSPMIQWISRSNSDNAANTVSMNRPCGVLVSTFSLSDTS